MMFTQDNIVQFIELIINLHTHCLMQIVMNQEFFQQTQNTNNISSTESYSSDLYITNFLKTAHLNELSEMIMKWNSLSPIMGN